MLKRFLFMLALAVIFTMVTKRLDWPLAIVLPAGLALGMTSDIIYDAIFQRK